MVHDLSIPMNALEAWLDQLDARLPGHPALAALRSALRGNGPEDPGFERLRGLLDTALHLSRRPEGGTPATATATAAADIAPALLRSMQAGWANAVRQVEAFAGIQHCLATGERWPAFHGWAISPDIGLWLVNRVFTIEYDAVIEFGSGTSTWLLARAMDVRPRTSRSSARPRRRPVLSFEHDEAYLESTRQLLASRAQVPGVELIHAPFTEWQEDGQAWRFYDCQARLLRLARALSRRRARILVLVDGPPGQTGRHARYPAVPHVFGALGKHHIDLVLDDADRPEEKAVIDRWRTYWTARSIPFEEHTEPSEKGLYIATTQPPPIRGSTP